MILTNCREERNIINVVDDIGGGGEEKKKNTKKKTEEKGNFSDPKYVFSC